MSDTIVYNILRFFFFLGRWLPKWMLYTLVNTGVMIFYKSKKKQRNIAINNLKLAYPSKSMAQVEQIAKQSYLSLGRTITEIALMVSGRYDSMASIVNAKEAIQKLEKIKEESRHGIVVVSAHYGNWELLGTFLGLAGLDMHIVSKTNRNNLLYDNYIVPLRQKHGTNTMASKGVLIAMTKILRRNGAVALLIDQFVAPPNGVEVRFFGRDTYATKAVAALERKYSPTVVPIFIERVGRQHRVNILDPINSTDRDITISQMTQLYYEAIESQIRKSPEQWLWLYNRWKGVTTR